MQSDRFDAAVRRIRSRDTRFNADAYHFLRDALDHTVRTLRGDEAEEHRHVTGPELVRGFVAHAQEEYRSMAVSVLDTWGVREDRDIGAMVFQLIEAGAFRRSEGDSPADFENVLDLREALLAPYRPARRHPDRANATGSSHRDNRPSSGEPPARGNQPAKSPEGASDN